MQKYFLYCIFHFIVLPNSVAQIILSPNTQVKNALTHEIGFNSLTLLKQVFNFSNTSNNIESPYLIMYKLGLGKNFLRASIGGSYSNRVEQIDGFLDSKTVRNTALSSRIGYERQHTSNRIRFSYGIDGTWDIKNNANIADSGFDQVYIVESENSFGGGPFMGISLNLTKHLSLYTEVGAYFTYTVVSKQTDFVKNPEFNDIENKATLQKINYLAPTSLFLLYKF
jgi:hypothetical protein